MALWELIAPRRALTTSKALRWLSNILLTVVNSVAVPIVFVGFMAVSMATFMGNHGWGLLNLIPLPYTLEVVFTVILFDCLIYWQHVLVHRVPMLWKFHRVHHSDTDLDVTSGARFHTIEILLSMLLKLIAIAIIGPPALGILLFEVILNGAAMFNHSNVKLPLSLDRILRLIIVTPDMHRVHHSVHRDETDSNFGFNLPWWDRLFGTYTAQPRDGHDGMTIGVHEFRDAREQMLDRLLTQPFREPPETEENQEASTAKTED